MKKQTITRTVKHDTRVILMRKAILLLILAPPLFATASDHKCADIGGALEQSLFDAVVHDININGNDIIRAKTHGAGSECFPRF